MNKFSICFVVILFIVTAAAEACDKCVSKDKCTQFGNLSTQEQSAWIANHSCDPPDDQIVRSQFYGFDPIAKGDYICCSDSLWPQAAPVSSSQTVESRFGGYDGNAGYNNYPDQGNLGYNRPKGWGGYPGNENFNNRINNGYDPNQGYPSYGSYNPGVNSQNPNYYTTNNNNPYVTPGGNTDNVNGGGQCAITSFPPKPASGCCGREATDSDRIIGKNKKPKHYYAAHQNPRYSNANQRPPRSNNFNNPVWSSFPNFPDYGMGLDRVTRSTDGDIVDIDIGNRIAGGHETDFTQFPWTVLLKTTFDYGTKRAAFNCGGSLISSKYVLTAGHCVYDSGGKIIGAEVYLAEYDKRTFPKDCKFVLGQGQKCIENIVMNAEDVILHPEYDDDKLLNDIAMLRLQGNAPYTDYIRPICLPTIDIDSPDFMNIRLAVAGWGRNGRYRSDIKQSTIVNLVPQDKCKTYYPTLTRRSMCAAGYTGEDTCKGDSGGPLMTVYGGKYEVVGIVSGKRADSPCGTSVPSLYTNVYHYRDWIRSNIKN